MIKKIVFSSGTYYIFHQITTINYFIKNNYFDIKNIEEIFCTSSGSIAGLLLCLDIDFETIYQYALSRPWHKLFHLDASKIFNAYNNCGIYDINVFKKGLEPLFKLNNISLDITLKELFLKSKKKLHIYATNTDTLEKTKFNFETTPDLKVLEAIYMSCSVPIIFKPINFKNICYNDGAFSCRFPISEALENTENSNEILGINVKVNKTTELIDCKNLLTYITSLTRKYANNKILVYDESNLKKVNIYHIDTNNSSLDDIYNMLTDISYRKTTLNNIEKEIEIYLNKL